MNLVTARKIASDLKIAGRSKMNKDALISAIASVMDELHSEAIAENRTRVTRKIAAGYFASVAEIDAQYVTSLSYVPAKTLKGAPMGSARRKDNYLRQNGCERLTAKQNRRVGKKAARKLSMALAA